MPRGSRTGRRDRGEMQIILAALLHLGIGDYAGAYWNLYRADFCLRAREEGIVKEAGLISNEERPVASRNKGCVFSRLAPSPRAVSSFSKIFRVSLKILPIFAVLIAQ